MSEWRTIDTAPTGGSDSFLLGAKDWVCEGYYSDEAEAWYMANCHWTDNHDGEIHPTHWRPLPEPPQ